MKPIQFFSLIVVYCLVAPAFAQTDDEKTTARTASGVADVVIQARVAPESAFAGFFDVEMRQFLLDDGQPPSVESGKIALAFDDLGNPVDYPLSLSGLFLASVRDTHPARLQLILQSRRPDERTFEVKLIGVERHPLVGVAVLGRDAITIRLLDSGPRAVVFKLKKQGATIENSPVSRKSALGDAGTAGVVFGAAGANR